MASKEKKSNMLWLLFALGAMFAWGVYGPFLHAGQAKLGDPMKALLCVGGAYFFFAVLMPVLQLSNNAGLGDFDRGGVTNAFLSGSLGAIGAICIIFAFKNGGVPNYVMPIVFGGAPLVNVLFTMYLHPPEGKVNPMLFLGYLITAGGAAMVFYFKPKG